MTLYKYRLNRSMKIEKTVLTVDESNILKNHYCIQDCNVHPYVKKAHVDNFGNNITTALYLTKEDDKAAVEHFKKLIKRRRDTLFNEFLKADKKLNAYNGDIEYME